MKLSNTMIMNETLLPNSKKAFTLAEVLITLSILGVVAALTIPSLVNRQSEMAAIVKLKKAISQFEQVTEVYMAENEAQDIKGLVKDSNCTGLADYFKVVDTISTGQSKCDFTTADGVEWVFSYNDTANKIYAIAYDSKTSPKYGVAMRADDGAANKSAVSETIASPKANVYSAATFLQISKPADVTGKSTLATKS